MNTPEEIVTDKQLDEAWANADFGNTAKRDVLKNALLKYACGFGTGHTIKQIAMELRLVNVIGGTLTIRGRKYLWAAYSGGVSV